MDENKPTNDSPAPDMSKELAELESLRKEAAELRKAKASHEREKLSAEERVKADSEAKDRELAELRQEREKLHREKRSSAFTEEVAKLAPNIPRRRLQALLREVEIEGIDIAPESVSLVQAKRALEKLREIDPASFLEKAKDRSPPVPGAGSFETLSGSDYWRRRGALVGGHVKE